VVKNVLHPINQGWATLFVSRATLVINLVYAGQYKAESSASNGAKMGS
jgi:hypothetical protein